MKQLVIDAGPLIALFYAKDPQHAECVAGFEQLNASKTLVLTPIPVVFEVYKWLLQRVSLNLAQQTLEVMVTQLYTIPIRKEDLSDLQTLSKSLLGWRGSLEDAAVITIAFRYRCPVWTINYRDFSPFRALQFWVPGSL